MEKIKAQTAYEHTGTTDGQQTQLKLSTKLGSVQKQMQLKLSTKLGSVSEIPSIRSRQDILWPMRPPVARLAKIKWINDDGST